MASVESAQRSVTELRLGVASDAGVALLPASVAKRPAMAGVQCKADRGAGAELRRRPHFVGGQPGGAAGAAGAADARTGEWAPAARCGRVSVGR